MPDTTARLFVWLCVHRLDYNKNALVLLGDTAQTSEVCFAPNEFAWALVVGAAVSSTQHRLPFLHAGYASRSAGCNLL